MVLSTTLSETMVDATAKAQRVLSVGSDGTAGFTPAEVAVEAPYSNAAASVTTSYVSVLAATAVNAGARILFLENTDTVVAMLISIDAGTTLQWQVNPGKTKTIDLAAAGLSTSSAIYVKKGAGIAGAGSFYIERVR